MAQKEQQIRKSMIKRKKTKTTATRTFKLYVSWPDFYFIRCLLTFRLGF